MQKRIADIIISLWTNNKDFLKDPRGGRLGGMLDGPPWGGSGRLRAWESWTQWAPQKYPGKHKCSWIGIFQP